MVAHWIFDLRQPEGGTGEIRERDAAGVFHVRQLAHLAAAAIGRHLVLITHGFNVSHSDGIQRLGATAATMNLPGNYLVVAVLWPGDFIVPIINYPFEFRDAKQAGQRLARALHKMPGVQAISGFSHSLGARLLLEAALASPRKFDLLCLTAAAADDDIFGRGRQYHQVLPKVERLVILHSKADIVLRLAYPTGDIISDIFMGDNDSPWGAALGYSGPNPTAGVPREIPQYYQGGWGHFDYLGAGLKPDAVARFVRDVLITGGSVWPPAPPR